MNKEKKRKYIFAQLNSLPNAFQYVEVTNYIKSLEEENSQLKAQRQELRDWLEEEKDRLARECSQIYEDSLGKTRLVNKDIFNEVNRIISKLNELEGVNND